MQFRTFALSSAATLSLSFAAHAQMSGGAASGGATSSAPAAPPAQTAPQETYTPAPPPPPPPPPTDGWYLGLGAGWDSPDDLKFGDILGNTGTLQRNDNILLAGAIGYRFPDMPIRLEVEGGYTWHDIHQIQFSGGPAGGTSASTSGHSDLGHVLVNAVYDIPLTDRWAVSLGAGAGGGFSDLSVNSSALGISGSASKAGFMWQGIGGLTYKVAPNMDLFADYRYRDAMTSRDVTLNNGDIVHVHNTTENAVLVGLRWYLWSPGY